jgi:hypothetical protein
MFYNKKCFARISQSIDYQFIENKSNAKRSKNQLPLEPPVLIGFLVVPVDFVLALAINLELPPCTVALVVLVEFLAAIFLLIANPIVIVLGYKYN